MGEIRTWNEFQVTRGIITSKFHNRIVVMLKEKYLFVRDMNRKMFMGEVTQTSRITEKSGKGREGHRRQMDETRLAQY